MLTKQLQKDYRLDRSRTRRAENGLTLNTQQMQVFDQFYRTEMARGLKQIKKQMNHEKQAFSKNNPSEFTLERLQNLENKVQSDFQRETTNDVAFSKVTEITDTFLKKDRGRSQVEVLRGRFNLNISSKQTMPQKIEKFACEPVAFHLHKRNDFLQRLLGKEKSGAVKDRQALRDIVLSVLGET